MAISRPPYILVIHLKRFAYANMNAKLNKAVRFSTEFNLPCMIDGNNNHVNNNNDVNNNHVNDGNMMVMMMIKYQLYAVIVHSGSSTHSGHYYAYVKVTHIYYDMS